MASEAVLAWDFGSTETRGIAAYRDRKTGKIIRIIIENRDDKNVKWDAYNQFSSRILVLDDNPQKYIGNAIQSGPLNREESSVKYAPYVILGKTEKFLAQYPILQRLLDEKASVGDDAFCARLEEALNQFLRFILTATKKTLVLRKPRLGEEQLRIKKVVLTIPSQWNLNFEDLYRRLFLRTFRQVFADQPQLFAEDLIFEFPTEGDALAHYIFHESHGDFRLGGGMPDIEEILSKTNAQCFIDCGGHNSNSILTSFNRNMDGSGALCKLGSAKGAGGGSEMLYHDVAEQLVAQCHDEIEAKPQIPHWVYYELKRQTVPGVRQILDGAGVQSVLCPAFGNFRETGLRITPEMCHQGFKKGFTHVKRMIKQQLQELVEIKNRWGPPSEDHIASIIVSGGSSLHPEFVEWIKALCNSLSLDEPHFTKSMEIQFGPCRIATGGAYASLTTLSVESFAEKCAFGLQKCNVTRNKKELDREDSATTIWTKERGVVPAEVVATGELAEYRIVCQPFLDSFVDQLETHRSGVGSSSYDFLVIGSLPNCHKYRVEFNLKASEKQVELKLERIPASTGRTVAHRSAAIVLGPFPVQVEPGSGNLLIQLDHDELNRQIRQAFGPYMNYSYRGNDHDDLPDADGTDGGGGSDEDDNLAGTENSPDAGDIDDGSDSDEDDDQPRSSHALTSTAARASSSSASAPNVVRHTIETPAPGSSASANRSSSTYRGTFPSKDTTRRVTEGAFRSSNSVSRRVPSNGHAGSGATGAERASTSGTIVGRASLNPSNKGQASSTRDTAPTSMAARSQSSASASKKRAAPPKADDPRPQKRAHISGGPSSSTSAARTENTAPRGSSGYRGTAFLGRQPSTTLNANPGHGAASRSRDRPSLDLRAPSRRASRDQSFTYSDRHREGNSRFPSDLTARRDPHNNIILDGNAPAFPRQSHDGSAAPRPGPSSATHTPSLGLAIRGPRPASGSTSARGQQSAAPGNGATASRGTRTSGARPVGSTRPASGSHSVRTSGPATSQEQHPSGFNGFGPANRRRGPPTSD